MRDIEQKRVLTNAFHLAHYIFPEGGTCLEFGVWKGRSFVWQARQIYYHYPKSRLIGFDSWQGLPPETGGVWRPERHAEGQFSASRGEVSQALRSGDVDLRADLRFTLVDGFFENTLTPELQATIHDLIFVNIDVDVHSSTLDLLGFIGPLLRPGVMLYWDDWQDPNDYNPKPWGERLAWEEWYERQSALWVETIEVNAVNQRSMLVTRVAGDRLSHERIAAIRYRCLEIMP